MWKVVESMWQVVESIWNDVESMWNDVESMGECMDSIVEYMESIAEYMEQKHSTWNPPGMWGQGKVLPFPHVPNTLTLNITLFTHIFSMVPFPLPGFQLLIFLPTFLQSNFLYLFLLNIETLLDFFPLLFDFFSSSCIDSISCGGVLSLAPIAGTSTII